MSLATPLAFSRMVRRLGVFAVGVAGLALGGCASPLSIVITERWNSAEPRDSSCEVSFVDAATSIARPIARLRIETADPTLEAWRAELRRQACALGARLVQVEPWREFRNARRYCGGVDSFCREQVTRVFLADALVYAVATPVESRRQ